MDIYFKYVIKKVQRNTKEIAFSSDNRIEAGKYSGIYFTGDPVKLNIKH